LPAGKLSGLKEAWRILKGIEGIRFITFTERDVARHRLVQEIIAAYEKNEAQSETNAQDHTDKSPG
jgi:phosphate starvation-inducible protein PhoH and related proteins